MTSIDELTLDITELRHLLTVATRPSVRAVLQRELDKCAAAVKSSAAPVAPVAAPVVAATAATGAIKLTNYAWDQSEKFVKLYITLAGAHTTFDDQVTFTTTDKSVHIIVRGVRGNNYEFAIQGLLHAIDPAGSYFKLKTDNVLIMLKKAQPLPLTWSALTKVEQVAKDAKSSKIKNTPTDSSDPQAGLMNMMKQMYDEGDDEMKRTIKKTWFESQNKKGGPASFDGM